MTEKVKNQVAPDGTRVGDPIEGSKYYRTFCANCLQPIRVSMNVICSNQFCSDCSDKTIENETSFVDLRDLHNYPQAENLRHHLGDGLSSETFEKKIRRKF